MPHSCGNAFPCACAALPLTKVHSDGPLRDDCEPRFAIVTMASNIVHAHFALVLVSVSLPETLVRSQYDLTTGVPVRVQLTLLPELLPAVQIAPGCPYIRGPRHCVL